MGCYAKSILKLAIIGTNYTEAGLLGTGRDAPCACSLVAGRKAQERVDIGTGWLSVLGEGQK